MVVDIRRQAKILQKEWCKEQDKIRDNKIVNFLAGGKEMDTVELIIEAYTKVVDGVKRCDLRNDEGTVVKAYKAGTIIRIDIKEEE